MAISVSVSSGLSPAGVPRIRIQIDGASGSTAEVARVDEYTSTTRPVRQGSPAALVSGSAVIYDYESVFGNMVHYVVTDSASQTGTSGSVYVYVAVPWLIHPGDPEKSIPLSVTTWPTWTRAISQGVFQPINRVNQVVVSSLRQSRTGDLIVYTETAQQRDAMARILADGSPLLIRGSNEGAGTFWVSVADVTQEPAGVDLAGYMIWTLSLTEVDAPPQRSLPPVSYSTSTAWFTSYADALEAAPTYADRIGGSWIG